MKKILFAVPLLFAAVAIISISNVQAITADQSAVISSDYIVVLNDSTIDSAATSQDIAHKHGFIVAHQYSRALKGFAATIPLARLNAVKQDPRVAFVSEDKVVSINNDLQRLSSKGGNGGSIQPSQVVPTGVKRIGATTSANMGTGVGVAIIDTGIDLTHPDLIANIGGVNKTCVTGTRNANDDNGHGTHVAGTIAATNNSIGVVGVAPGAMLYAVKALNKNGSGTWSSIICGIDWVTANALRYNIKVANMSLGGSGTSDNNCGNTNNDALHKAICQSVAQGVTYIVAAGNESANAGNSVPASYDDAVITVSALADSDGASGGLGGATSYGADDTFATFSNYGTPVDIGAPGVSIFSTWKGGGYNTISGTSMATPHVSGAAALYIAAHPGSTWTQVKDSLRSLGEVLGLGHTDPSGLHPEPMLRITSL